jgi:selenide,water dikinase
MGFEAALDYNLKMIAFDAQTSGGLLMSVSPDKVEAFLADLRSSGLTSAAVIGEVTDLQDKYLYLEN